MTDLLLTLLIPIMLGYILVKTGYLPNSINRDIKLFVMRVAVPCRIYISMFELNLETVKQIIPMSLSFILMSLIIIFLTFIIFYRVKDKSLRALYMITITFGNYGYMGWAVVDGAYGSEGLVRAMFFTTLWWPMIYIGTFLIGKLVKIEHKLDVKSYRLNIFIPSTVLVLGILSNYLDLNIYTPLEATIVKLGDMTVPLILFSIGLNISIGKSVKNIKEALIPIILRPIIGLIAGIIVINILNLKDDISVNTILLESTMPVAVMSVLLADMLNIRDELPSSILILSTLLSLVTIPLTLLLLT